MPMFDKRKSDQAEKETTSAAPPAPPPRANPAPTAARDATIGMTIAIDGDVTGDENLVIHGKVGGTVVLEHHDLTIGQSGLVTASVKAKVVRIEGEVTGDIDGIEKVIVAKTGRVRGNIVAPGVSLEDGAKFKGSIDMDPASARQTAPRSPLNPVPPEEARAVPDHQREDAGPRLSEHR